MNEIFLIKKEHAQVVENLERARSFRSDEE